MGFVATAHTKVRNEENKAKSSKLMEELKETRSR